MYTNKASRDGYNKIIGEPPFNKNSTSPYQGDKRRTVATKGENNIFYLGEFEHFKGKYERLRFLLARTKMIGDDLQLIRKQKRLNVIIINGSTPLVQIQKESEDLKEKWVHSNGVTIPYNVIEIRKAAKSGLNMGKDFNNMFSVMDLEKVKEVFFKSSKEAKSVILIIINNPVLTIAKNENEFKDAMMTLGHEIHAHLARSIRTGLPMDNGRDHAYFFGIKGGEGMGNFNLSNPEPHRTDSTPAGKLRKQIEDIFENYKNGKIELDR